MADHNSSGSKDDSMSVEVEPENEESNKEGVQNDSFNQEDIEDYFEPDGDQDVLILDREGV